MKKNYTHIFWDWNGTLLADVVRCMNIINSMLEKRGLKQIASIREYREGFKFPVIESYRDLGFDFEKEPFNILAKEYVKEYYSLDINEFPLRENCEFVLDSIKEMGLKQIILSASEQSYLLSQVGNYGITEYFDKIIGISDILAGGKVEVGLSYISEQGIRDAVLIGDTIHDFEVGKALGIDVLLLKDGHQDEKRLLSCGVPVLDDIRNIMGYINLR